MSSSRLTPRAGREHAARKQGAGGARPSSWKSWWRVPSLRAFALCLVISPLVGNPCASFFGDIFGGVQLGSYFGLVDGNWPIAAQAPAAVKDAAATAAWTTNGPYGGPVRYGIAIDPSNASVIYAASSGGVFKSTDAGATWKLSSSGITDMYEIHAVAVDPSNSAIVYAGSADTIDVLFRSTDGGAHWKDISGTSLFAGTVDAIAVDPRSSSTIMAGSPFGLWRTVDNGANWFTPIELSQKVVVTLATDRATPGTFYAMTSGSGVWKSTDGGGSWAAVNGGFGGSGGTVVTGGNALAVDPTASSRVYAGSYRSTNGGASWTAMTGLGSNVTSIAVDPQSPSTVYAGDDTGGAYRSTDAGATWAKVNTGLANLSVWRVAAAGGAVYAATDAGMWKSTNAGANWAAANAGLANTNVQAVVVDPFVPANVYAGTYTNGIFRSADSGASWVNVFPGTPATTQIMGIAVDPKTPGTLYAANWYNGVMKSADRGATWTSARVNGRPISIAVDPVASTNVYAGTVGDGVFKSADGGATWAQVNNGLPRRPENANIFGAIAGIAVSPKDQSVWAFVQTGSDTFVSSVSRDGGATWSSSYPGWDPTVKLSGPALLDFLANTVGLESISANWQNPQYPDPSTCLPIMQVVADPLDPTIGYAASSCGVGRAKVAAGKLTPMALAATTPAWVAANALAITPTGSDLYAGMQWGGVYKLTIDTTPKVVEYHLTSPDHYFITADPVEQAAVDSGAGGPFFRTGGVFKAGGSTPVCRFFGNTNINPATGGFYGPTSHFYTADANECAGLKAQFVADAKSWKFESNDFLTTPATNGTCPANTTPIYRAYNNAFVRGEDSNHRITSDQAAYQSQVAKGWIGEGIVMCAPR